MRISRLTVDGYRHFINQEILFEPDTTVLAGANNSGKTSLIDLLNVMLGRDHKFSIDDFNALGRHEWSSQLVQALIEGDEAFAKLVGSESFAAETPMIKAQLEITYDPDLDDIREFADFLMDLDLEQNAFYFTFQFAPNVDKLRALLGGAKDQLLRAISAHGWKSLPSSKSGIRELRKLQSQLCRDFFDSCEVSVSFSESSFTYHVEMKHSRLRELFEVRFVKASRPLDDAISDKTGELSQRLLHAMKGDERWDNVVEDLPDGVIAAIHSAGIGDAAEEAALQSLNETLTAISATNGKSKAELSLDFDLTDAQTRGLVGSAIRARYETGGVPLGERSQGLGYSNLIILHLEVEAFIREARKSEKAARVNLLIVEEPEAHMHPQMQNAFIKHLFSRIALSAQSQALVTTHSSEIIHSSEMQHLRVLKVRQGFANIVDLRDFYTTEVINSSEKDQRLFSLLYAINFADVLFADKVVMYEGDTERMYFQALIHKREDLVSLRSQYVSYVQVGGAFAHRYLSLVADTLQIKTLIVTDTDYEKESEAVSVEELEPMETTNATLNHLFQVETGELDEQGQQILRNPTLGDLYKSRSDELGISEASRVGSVAVSFQSEREGFARTLEEAILSKCMDLKVWELKPRKWWLDKRSESSMSFSIPSKKPNISIRQIVKSTSNGKTDFMYSIIMNKGFEQGVPEYIIDGLKWLSDD